MPPGGQPSSPESSESTAFSHSQSVARTNQVNWGCFVCVASESSALSLISRHPIGARAQSDCKTLYVCVCVCQSVSQASGVAAAEPTCVIRVSGAQSITRLTQDQSGQPGPAYVCVCVRNPSLSVSGARTCHPSHQRSALHNDQPPPVGWTVKLLSLPLRARHQREQEPGAMLSGF